MTYTIAIDYLANLKPTPETRCVQQLLMVMKEVLLKALNASWLVGWCPQSWRNAIICPISKKGKNTQKIANHGPIALTLVISQILERLIGNRLAWWLYANELLSPSQAGFRKGRGRADQTLRLSQFVSRWVPGEGENGGLPPRLLLRYGGTAFYERCRSWENIPDSSNEYGPG